MVVMVVNVHVSQPMTKKDEWPQCQAPHVVSVDGLFGKIPELAPAKKTEAFGDENRFQCLWSSNSIGKDLLFRGIANMAKEEAKAQSRRKVVQIPKKEEMILKRKK